jgi:hypothetical protein
MSGSLPAAAANVPCGSFATDAAAATRVYLSAFARERTNGPTSRPALMAATRRSSTKGGPNGLVVVGRGENCDAAEVRNEFAEQLYPLAADLRVRHG